MIRKSIIILLSIILMINPINNVVYAADDSSFTVNAKSAIIMEPITGKIIFEQNSHEQLKPASVTKIMTILLIYEAIKNSTLTWDEVITISDHAASMGGSQVWLEPGEKQTVSELLKCIVIASANDGAVAMAERIGGSESSFANMMNDKAKALGMNDTHFVNASGLDSDDHYTSAYDIALMSRELTTKYPAIFELSTTWQDEIIHSTKRGDEVFGLTNTNKLLQWYDGTTGLKTGSTSKAKYCLSGTATRNGLDLIAVVMAAPDYKTRFNEVIRMFDYGFSVCKKYNDDIKDSFTYEMPIKGGQKEVLILKPVENFNTIFTEKNIDINKIDKRTVVEEFHTAPINKGEVLGYIEYTHGDKVLGQVDLVATEDVKETDLMYYLKSILDRYF